MQTAIQENVDVNIDAEFVVKFDVVVYIVSYILLVFLNAIHATTQFSLCNIYMQILVYFYAM